MILFSMLLSFVLLNLGVVLMIHYSVWIGLAICIVSGIRFLRDIDISRNSVIIPSENNPLSKGDKMSDKQQSMGLYHILIAKTPAERIAYVKANPDKQVPLPFWLSTEKNKKNLKKLDILIVNVPKTY